MRGAVVGVDVGGTFTDVFALDLATGRARIAKVPTTRPDQSGGFLNGIREVVPYLASVVSLVHGTTAGTNALLERKGARLGVITTEGFRDVLEMRRRDRPRTWGLRGDFVPVVPRNLRLEVPERVLADGTIERPVDLDAVRAAGRTLIEAGCRAVVVLFVNAYANPVNERAAVEVLRAIWPTPHVAASSEVLPEIREFERFSTAALNGYLQPEVAGYLARLETALKGGGFAGEFMIVQSNGGVMSVETACARPVRTALSGPSAGVIAASHIARSAGFDNVITGDMGGTSFDVSMIVDGRTVVAPQAAIDFGMVIRTPMIEITTIGAGGGSIASVDAGGLLQVGPESAGSDPGPVAYGRGNDRPTVTDANIVLGRIDPRRPLGSGLGDLDVEAARAAIATHVGKPLGLSVMDAAEAIVRVANSRMAGALRLVSIERGFDPERFTYMPFGGGGALHAGAMVEEVGIGRVLVPRFPGVTSAMGCVIADMRQDFVQTVNSVVESIDIERLTATMQAQHDAGNAVLDASGSQVESRQTRFELDMAYVGQTHTIQVPLAVAIEGGRVRAPTAEAIHEAFRQTYRGLYGRLLRNPVRVLNLRTTVIGTRPKFELSTLAPAADASMERALIGSRPVYLRGRWYDARVYARLDLPVGAEVVGPAVLEQPDATIFVEPWLVARVDAFGNVVMERRSEGEGL
ncbi:N-methylhydantoinase A [Tepidamorphus gemmatus]|uniref:N-methylhydantoinase A n=1 Tax=Tepidamorphus gemmatus TaxID=747076 RepID=A0A4R3MGS7_9HYPH|nr:hydantoinase/oxoprolinase family protein [Tepidamorphus gemmatus]TCT11569.1 N-methylhydantoinase A [Tepidamorphus gemmatus]